MKKFMYVLATVVVLAIASSCGNRAPKADAEVAVDSTAVVVDSLAVAVDSTMVENVAE